MGFLSKARKVDRYFSQWNLYSNFFHNLSHINKLTREPIIICGCPRSGTTLLMSIIDSHPEIDVIPFETTALQKRPIEKRIFKNDWLHFNFIRLQILFFLFSKPIKKTANRWCEKTPLNILNVKEIDRIYHSRVRFINIVRDGRAVVTSYHSRFGYMVSPELWYRCIQEAKEAEHMPNFMSINYERLVSEPDQCLSEIERFLGLNLNFDIESWLKSTRVKGQIYNLVNGMTEGSTINETRGLSENRTWVGSKSPNLAIFYGNDKYKALNNKLGYE